TQLHRALFAIPGLIGIVFMFLPGPRNPKLGLLSVHDLALVTLAAIYFGGPRHREPYDLIITVLAFEVYVAALVLAARFLTFRFTWAQRVEAGLRNAVLLRKPDHRTPRSPD